MISSIEKDSSLNSSISTKETIIKSKKSLRSAFELESTISLETTKKISDLIEDLSYTENIEKNLKNSKINYKIYEKEIWTMPNSIKKLQGINMLIPGSKCEMLKSFLAVKFTSKIIFIVISSNRMVFNENSLDEIRNFCNYLNEISPLGMFYTEIVKNNENCNKSIIALKKNILIDCWAEDSEGTEDVRNSKIASEFVDEIVRIDKTFYCTLIENLPVFLMKYTLFKHIIKHINPYKQNNSQKNYEIGKKSVLKAIKGMGFKQEKKKKIASAIGDLYNIDCAVKIDVNTQSLSSNEMILATSIELTNYTITIKLKLCHNQAVLSLKNEKTIEILEEFINYANNDLKKGQFKINHSKGHLYLEGNFVYFGMDFTEIQAGFQNLFSYLTYIFKKYGKSLIKIALKKSNEDNINAWDVYKNIMKTDFPEITYDYEQFAVCSISDLPGYMIIPKSFIVKKYDIDDYIKEKTLLQRLTNDIDEFYHITFNDEMHEIRYPQYNGCSLRKIIYYEIGKKGMKLFQDFILKLHGGKFRVKNFMDCINVIKENRSYYFSITTLPYYNCIEYVEEGISKTESKEFIMRITEEVFKLQESQKIPDDQLDFISESAFNHLDYTSLTGNLIDKTIELVPISLNEIQTLRSEKKINLLNIDSYIGFIKTNNNFYYKVQEKLYPLHTKTLSEVQIKNYFIEIINTVSILYNTNSLPGIIKYEDLYLNTKNVMKIRLQNRKNELLWMGHMKKATLEQRIIFSLSLLLYKMHIGTDFVDIFKCLKEEQLFKDLKNGYRIPIVPWDFEMKEPRIAEFMKKCWKYDFLTLEDMKNSYPNTFVI
ncbi:hypothetical protein SteCoe_34646 [Stentor coeruleus]|uniref:Uncharacterized protein n=1 Tax=Stentor coeruleus TaxID=5963 RepID=A0A1R2AU44_9CILI|nr:hypothetical protein SteCoe_34646 [Stentor coeruleus]